MIPAKTNRLVQYWFDGWCRRNLRKHFYRLHLYLESPRQWDQFDPRVPRLYVANHSSFWDGVVLNQVLYTRRKAQPLYCLIDLQQVRRHPFMTRVGGFSINRDSPRDALKAVRYAAELLNNPDHPAAIIVFPQGRIEHIDTTPVRVESAVTRIVENSPGLEVVPVSLRYEFWAEQRAEAMVHIGQVISASALAAIRAEGRDRSRGFRARVSDLIASRIAEGSSFLRENGRAMRPGDRILLRGRESISHWKRRLGFRDD